MLSLALLALSLSFLPSATVGADVNASSLGNSMVSAAWYTGWHVEKFPLSDVSWSKYTHMKYAFALTTGDGESISLVESDQVLLPQFVSAAHEHGVKASLSIGGWTGSRFFSANVASQQNRTKFVNVVTNLVKEYDLDGLDFDWEYPNHLGLGCNTRSPNDTANFLSFLQSLRQTSTGSDLVISLAMGLTPFLDESGNPSSNVSAFAEVLDYITLMNYDVWTFLSNSTTAGPTSPLNDTCAEEGRRVGSATSAVQAWTASGFPANKLVLGVPAYGHSFTVAQSNAFSNGSNTTLAAYPSYEGKPLGDAWDSEGGVDDCGATYGPSGVFSYWGLVEEGFLGDDGEVEDGIEYRYDECSQTPYVYDLEKEIMVSYDNVRSFTAKGDFVKSMGLKGFAMWEAGGDSDDTLLDAILTATIYGDPTKTSDNGSGSGAVASPESSADASTSLRATGALWILFVSLVMWAVA